MSGNSTGAARFREAYEIVLQNRLLMHKRPVTLSDRVAWWRRRWRYQFLSHYFSRPPGWRLYLRRLGGERVYPNFASLGPVKSGTSDLPGRRSSCYFAIRSSGRIRTTSGTCFSAARASSRCRTSPPIAAPPFDGEARRLLAEFYRPFNQQLYGLISRDLGW